MSFEKGSYCGCAVRLLWLLAGATILQPGAGPAAQITWTNTAGGNWNNPSNWAPNQVPGAADNVSLTNQGTYAVTLNVSGSAASLVVGGAGSGVQTLQANGFGLAVGEVSLQSGGVLALTNGTFTGAVSVGSGGLLLGNNATFAAQVTVQSGGQFFVPGTTSIGQGGQSANADNWLWVQNGGELDAGSSATLYLYAVMTNAGLANFTNYGITIYNNGTSGYMGGVWNEPSAVLNLLNTAGISGAFGLDYLSNQGTLNVANGTSTISVDTFTNSGTVATLPGTGSLRIGTLNGVSSLSGTYNAAAGTAIQFVAGNNPGTSAGTPLVLGGAGQYQFVAGTLMLTTNVIPGMLMTGGNLVLGPEFQGGAITNLALAGISLSNNLPIAGTLAMTNGTLVTSNILTNTTVMSLKGVTMYGAIDVAAGGLLDCGGATLAAQVTVQSGGEFFVAGTTSIGQGGQSANTNDWLWVKEGGELDAASSATLYLYAVMTNAGLANFTNYGITIYNNGASGYMGGVWNESSGLLNLLSTAGIAGAFGFDYLVNQGTIEVTNGASTISVSSLTNLGNVATLPGTGTLRIGTFNGLGSLFGSYNAAAGTTIQFVGGNNPGTSAGTPLVLGGAGQYQFVAGILLLPTNVIPGVAMMGGNVVLGTAFQGGAITNLVLEGSSLTNNLPIAGTLAMTNGTLVTSSLLTNTTVMSLNGVTMSGTLSVGAGALLSCSGSILEAQVTVQSGGRFLVAGTTSIGEGGQPANVNDWLWVQSGGELDAGSAASLYLYSLMTNAGLANFTNYGITLYNNDSSTYAGGVWNQPNGVLNLIKGAGIAGAFGFDYLVNEGIINTLSPGGSSTIDVDNFTNAATVNVLYGVLELPGAHTLFEPSGTLSVGVSSPTVFGSINVTRPAELAGTFGASFNKGFVPQIGASFTVLNYVSFSGAFSDTNFVSIAPAPSLPGLQHSVYWSTTYSNTFMTITAQQITDQFAFGGSNGAPGHQYVILSSTNVALPRTTWTPVATNYFDAGGSFIFTTNVDLARSQQFYSYRYQ